MFDRESGAILERLHLRPELTAFEHALRDRIARTSAFEDERVARVRSLERDPSGGLILTSEFVAGNRVSDLLDTLSRQSGDDATTPGVDTALGFLLEILPALAAMHAALGFSHGAVAPGRIVLTPAGQVVLLDSVFGHTLERLQFSRRRLWTELHIAALEAAGPPRFDVVADIGQASLTAIMLVVGRLLREHEYPDGLAALVTEVIEIAQIRGSARFASGLATFFKRTLPLPGRKPYATAEEAVTELRSLAREIGVQRCRLALAGFIKDMNRVRALAAEEESIASANEFEIGDEIDEADSDVAEGDAAVAEFSAHEAGAEDPSLVELDLDAEAEAEPFEIAAEAEVPFEAPDPLTFMHDAAPDPIAEIALDAERVPLAAIEEDVAPFVEIEQILAAPEPEIVTPAPAAVLEEVAAPAFAEIEEPLPIAMSAPAPEPAIAPPLHVDAASHTSDPATFAAIPSAVFPIAAEEIVQTREPVRVEAAIAAETFDAPAAIAPAPAIIAPEPIVFTPEPIVVTPEPIVVTREPIVVTPEPIVFTPEPIVVTPEPIVVTPAPVAITPAPVAAAPAAAPKVEPAPAESRRKQKRGSKKDRDKLRSNAAPAPPAPVYAALPTAALPVAVAPPPASRPAPVAAPFRPMEPAQHAQPVMAAPVPAPAIRVMPPAPATIQLKVKADPPTGYAPVSVRSERTEPGDISALPYVQRGVPASKSSFPWKIAAAAAIVIAAGVGAGRAYLPTRPAEPEKPAAAPAAPAKTVKATGTGALSITTQPAGAKVLVDGKGAGLTPLTLDALPPGKHTITFMTTTGTVKKTVHIESGKTVSLDVPIYSGWIAVFAPITLEIAENGKGIGTTEQGRLMLSPGRHQLTLTNRELSYTSVQTVDIEPGEERSITVQPVGELNLNAVPWAEVWIDGQKVGETPIAHLQVPLGTHEIVFKNAQLGERRVTSTVTASTPVTASVDFNKTPQP